MNKISRRRRVRTHKDLMFIFGALCLWTFGLIYFQEIIIGTVTTLITELLTVPNDNSCYADKSNTELKIFPKDSIFIISSTCKNVFSVYESCAIEAIFRGNTSNVHVLVTNPLKYSNYQDLVSDADDYIIKGYKPFQNNIHKINIDEFVKGTPVEGIFTDTFLGMKNSYRRVREVLKLAALYKFGGIAIDLEMLVTEPESMTEFFGPNGATKIGPALLGSAILALDKDTEAGRKFFENSFETLNEMRNDTDLDTGFLMTKAYFELCHINTTFVEYCRDFRIFDTKYFYPVNLTDYHKYFEEGDLIPDTYGYYIWDFIPEKLPKPNSLYWKLMEKYCPNMHNLIKNKKTKN